MRTFCETLQQANKQANKTQTGIALALARALTFEVHATRSRSLRNSGAQSCALKQHHFTLSFEFRDWKQNTVLFVPGKKKRKEERQAALHDSAAVNP